MENDTRRRSKGGRRRSLCKKVARGGTLFPTSFINLEHGSAPAVTPGG